MDETGLIQFHIDTAVDEGVTIGLLESHRILNQLLDMKASQNLPEHITREELDVFLSTYINQWKEGRRGVTS